MESDILQHYLRSFLQPQYRSFFGESTCLTRASLAKRQWRGPPPQRRPAPAGANLYTFRDLRTLIARPLSAASCRCLSISRCQLGKTKTPHEMEKGDPVSLAQHAFPLSETWNQFTVSYHAFGLVDAVSFLGRFQQVPKLVSQERAVAVLGRPSIYNLLLVGSTLARQKRHVPTIPVQTSKPLLNLPPIFSPTDGVQMPRHGLLVRPPSSGTNVDIQTRFNHPNVM
jgi:hypothetical protein